MKCGRKLQSASVYEELIRSPIEKLPLTEKKFQGLLKHTAICTVNDFLMDEENMQIRRFPHIGPVWSARIRRYAGEFVSV